ncbi:DNA polymerase III, subunit gamma and tau [Bifidobacterium saguini DSM 23967]|uniref:DNA polymerase III subunit gamma/tau n=1 Tax=Bifidobacterium saguini DSM 23967 TaxID=1437607 RepID=A0A087DBG0_9BIFI|nr:DNA polymerase III, subunit gamma and tau [Bifidobacterium saguini DSM 23967]
MALALYRRYRPDTFEGVIGQDQVTVPLMRALDEGKLTHAYLFSGPRGCGKTSSARILARCVNCAKGPTSHPCGECPSCKDLATGGPGSIDVVEIDAASHNGVDDARELRERAGFAPARDRYKIFILDEAHMVTQQGFNALLKIVEEPPEHVMFIFATTEPDKVIGTIRSRTHHYPFRLVPQEVMGPYLEKICDKEGIKPEPGVLKLAMRAGGGSMRDTLSVLDQLMVGSVEGVITHDAAVALLGFTPEALIGEAIDAVIDHNGETLYGVIQKVVVGGFDPRRFVEDLLARVRDLLVLTLAGDSAESVLSDTAEAEDMGDLHRQAAALGLGQLTAMADIINATLSSMTGAISPRMRLELLAARLLAGAESGFALAATAPTAGAPANAAATNSGSSAGAGAQHHAASGGFVGASRNANTQQANRGGFVGSSRNTTQGAQQPAQTVPTPQSNVSTNASDWTGTVTAEQSVPSASAAQSAPTQQPASGLQSAAAATPVAASAPAPANDTRSVDEKWDAAVAALPEAIREYVTRAKVPTVKFGTNRKGLPCLSLTFDQSLSQHAFALAVDSNGKKAAIVVQDAVRQEFGATTVIAPTPVAANGDRVESIKRMSLSSWLRSSSRSHWRKLVLPQQAWDLD